MAATTEETTRVVGSDLLAEAISTIPCRQSSSDRDIRFVPSELADIAIFCRAVIAAIHIFQRLETSTSSEVLACNAKISETQEEVHLSSLKYKKALSVLSKSSTREVHRFTLISIYVDPLHIVRANTMWSTRLGSQFLHGVGSYSNVLSIFTTILGPIDSSWINRQIQLFQKIREKLLIGEGFNNEDLFAINPRLRAEHIDMENLMQTFVRAIYLIYFLEITRRQKFTELSEHARNITNCREIMLVFWSQVIFLLEKGALTIQEAFDKDSPYALATRSLGKERFSEIMHICRNIHEKYITFIKGNVLASAEGNVIPICSMQSIHGFLTESIACSSPVCSRSPTRAECTGRCTQQLETPEQFNLKGLQRLTSIQPGEKSQRERIQRVKRRLLEVVSDPTTSSTSAGSVIALPPTSSRKRRHEATIVHVDSDEEDDSDKENVPPFNASRDLTLATTPLRFSPQSLPPLFLQASSSNTLQAIKYEETQGGIGPKRRRLLICQ